MLSAFIRFGLKHIIWRWSRVYRWACEDCYRDYPVQAPESIEALARTIEGCEWTADGIRQIWDAWSYPGLVQWRIDHQVKEIGDCDEFAGYVVAAIHEALAAGHDLRWGGQQVLGAHVLTTVWRRGWGGHAVALLELAGGELTCMDYGLPWGRFKTPADAALQVARNYSAQAEVLAWALYDSELRPVKAG